MEQQGVLQEQFDNNYKLCKKVSQLTKVIFHLNTRNDQYQNNLKSVVNCYEQELDKVVHDANEIIQRHKLEQSSLLKPEDVQQSISTMQQNFDDSKIQYQEDFRMFQTQVQDRQRNLERKYREKVESLTAEISTFKELLMNMQIKVMDVSERSGAQSQLADKEINRLSQMLQQSERLSQNRFVLLQAAEQQLSSVQIEQDNENSFLQENIKNLSQQLDEAQIQAERLLKSQTNNLLTERDQQLKETNSRYQKQIEQFKANQNEFLQTIAALNDSIKQMKDEQVTSNDDYNKFKTQSTENKQQLQREKQILEEQKQKIQSENAELMERINTIQQEQQQLSKNSLEQQEKFNQKIQELQDSVKSTAFNSNSINFEKEQLKMQYQAEIIEKTAEIKNLSSKNAEILKQYDFLVLENQIAQETNNQNASQKLKQVETLRIQLQTALEEKKSLQETYQKCLQQTETLKLTISMSKEGEIKDLHSKHFHEMEQTQTQFHAQIKDKQQLIQNLKQENELQRREIESIRNLQSSGAKELREKLETIENNKREIDALNQQIKLLNEKLNSVQSLKSEKEKNIQKVQKNLDSLRQQTRDQESLIKTQTVKIDDLEDLLRDSQQKRLQETKELRAEISQYKSELEIRDNSHNQSLEQMKQEWEYDMKLKLRKIKEENVFEIQRIKDEAEMIKERSEIQQNKAIKEMQRELKDLNERLRYETNEWIKKIDQMDQDQVNQLQAQFDKFEKDKIELESVYQGKIQELEKKLQSEKVEFKQQIDKETENEIRINLDKHQKELARAQNEHEDVVEKLKISFDLQFKDKSQEYNQKIALLQAQLNREKSLNESNEKDWEQRQQLMDSNYLSICEEQKNLEKKKTELTKNIEELQLHLKLALREKQQFDERQASYEALLKEEFKKKEETIREVVQKEIEKTLEQQMTFYSSVETKFQEVQNAADERFECLSINHVELQDLFEHRPSQTEDLHEMDQLKEIIKQKDDENGSLNDKIKALQLELANRQSNYNQVFNIFPNVGVLNPIENRPVNQNKSLHNQNQPLFNHFSTGYGSLF